MPIYEYRCQDCGKLFEVFQKTIKTRSEPACSYCGGKNVKRLISRPGMVKVEWETASTSTTTCCGRSEPCETPPCSDGSCQREE